MRATNRISDTAKYGYVGLCVAIRMSVNPVRGLESHQWIRKHDGPHAAFFGKFFPTRRVCVGHERVVYACINQTTAVMAIQSRKWK